MHDLINRWKMSLLQDEVKITCASLEMFVFFVLLHQNHAPRAQPDYTIDGFSCVGFL